MPTTLTWDMQINGEPLRFDTASTTLVWDGTFNHTPTHNTMPNDNRISAEVTDANKALALTKLTEFKALFPFLINLTKEERVALPKLGGASLLFDEQCTTYMSTAPNLVPPFLSVAELQKDRALRLVLADLLRETRKVCEMLDDTHLLVGSEIWLADLTFYQTVRQAARRDVPGADAIYDDLRERFPGPGGDPEEEEPPAPPAP